MTNGNILLNEQPVRHKLARFIEKKIHQWVEHREGVSKDDVAYHVAFTEDSDVKQVSCVTEIQLAGCTWRGCELAGDSQQAFMHSLKRLQPH